MAAYVALDGIATVKYRHHPQKEMGNQLQVFPWDKSDHKADQGLHRRSMSPQISNTFFLWRKK
jgi:hypothetical protein